MKNPAFFYFYFRYTVNPLGLLQGCTRHENTYDQIQKETRTLYQQQFKHTKIALDIEFINRQTATKQRHHTISSQYTKQKKNSHDYT